MKTKEKGRYGARLRDVVAQAGGLLPPTEGSESPSRTCIICCDREDEYLTNVTKRSRVALGDVPGRMPNNILP